MRLLAEWVSCGWRAARPEEAAPERRGAREKERLAPGEGGVRRRRRRRAAAYGGGGAGAADPWRPSLGTSTKRTPLRRRRHSPTPPQPPPPPRALRRSSSAPDPQVGFRPALAPTSSGNLK
uniref:Uncharacterized protein n=1 Tax=Ananas comosus var. bracteatus TaxID=296719 RepID=A0A6V7NXD9_ANACO|nr:unnamed protein product [Ananas comosus var. bracteatus]